MNETYNLNHKNVLACRMKIMRRNEKRERWKGESDMGSFVSISVTVYIEH